MSSANVAITPELNGHYSAPAGAGTAPGVVVLMEAFGLTDHIRGVCDRLAAAGFAALAPDLYRGRLYSAGQMNEAIAALTKLSDDAAIADIGAALDWLAGRKEVDAARLGVSGFCMGGRLAFLSGCRHTARLRASVSFYGSAVFPEGDKDRLGRTPPIGEAAALQAPLLLIYGGTDSSITPAERGRIAQRLGELDKRHVMSVYPGVGHAFCCEERPSYAPREAEMAFAEMFDFLRRAFSE
jgi:carboxymethylenebutenolidase